MVRRDGFRIMLCTYICVVFLFLLTTLVGWCKINIDLNTPLKGIITFIIPVFIYALDNDLNSHENLIFFIPIKKLFCRANIVFFHCIPFMSAYGFNINI